MQDEPQDSTAGAETAANGAVDHAAEITVEPGEPAANEQTVALDSALEELRAAESPADELIADEMADAAPVGEESPAGEVPTEAPEPAARMIDPADAVLVEAVSGGLTWIPFAVYLGLWIVLAGLSAYLLYGASPDQPARWTSEYVPLLWSGVALTALGPVLSVTVWLVARLRRPKSERRGLFASAMTRGALAAFFGVAIWVATLFVLELVASGGAL